MPQISCRQIRTRGLRPDWDYLYREVGSWLDKTVKPDLLGYLNRIVADWKEEHKPAFRARKRMAKQYIKVHVYPTGPSKQIWQWVSVTGTKPHKITVRQAKWLMFKWGGPGSYLARTTRSGGYKGPGMATGSMRKMLTVDHPGYEPRRFEWWVARWYKPKFNRGAEAAFKRGIRRARAHGRGL